MRARFPASWIAAASLALSACGSTEGDLLEALRIDEEEPLCISSQMIGVDFFQANDGTRYFTKAGEVSFTQAMSDIDALPALIEEGYAEEEATSLPAGFARFVDAHVATDKITPFVGDLENLCVGSMRATEIIEYTEPSDAGQQITHARFKYDIEFNELVDDLDLEDALRKGPVGQRWTGKGDAAFVKTNKGWRLEMARWIEF